MVDFDRVEYETLKLLKENKLFGWKVSLITRKVLGLYRFYNTILYKTLAIYCNNIYNNNVRKQHKTP